MGYNGKLVAQNKDLLDYQFEKNGAYDFNILIEALGAEGVVPYNDGTGWDTDWFDIPDAEDAYDLAEKIVLWLETVEWSEDGVGPFDIERERLFGEDPDDLLEWLRDSGGFRHSPWMGNDYEGQCYRDLTKDELAVYDKKRGCGT